MKILKKMRLINWHRFPNETIEFGRAVLLSGENGAGKSTILDAIQFVITCSKSNFNKAAHEKGKRNLNSYIRCKTGQETRPYERTGELSAHIALEFFDESRKRSFVIGVVMDSQTEEKEPNTAWYLMENTVLSDKLFFNGKQIKGIQAFRATNKEIGNWSPTVGEARKMILSRLGRLNDKFFSLIPKAMAFKPIKDIKEFVYSYVLDEREVNIDSLRENVRSYRELERMLEDVRKRISELELIRSKEEETERYINLDKSYEYYIARAEQDVINEQLENAERMMRDAEQLTERLKLLLSGQNETKQTKEELRDALISELGSSSEYQALHEFERRSNELKNAIVQDKNDVKELKNSAKTAVSVGDALVEAALNEEIAVDTNEMAAFKAYINKLRNIDDCEYLSEIDAGADSAAELKTKLRNETTIKAAQLSVEENNKKEELRNIRHRADELRAHRFVYPRGVNELKQRIQDELIKLGKKTEARVLCEMLEIVDPEWQNAVEGYLNTQRFYIIVEPDDFDLALSVYDKLREAKTVYGVGLINTAKLEEYDEVPKGSLAETVSSKNIWARRYINMILGKVHCCDSYRELKKYPTAITKQCMRYQNHVVSAIKPEIYETPFIGAGAIKRQLAVAEEALKLTESEIKKLHSKIDTLNRMVKLADPAADIAVKNTWKFLERLRVHENNLNECKLHIKKLKENETLIQKTIQLDAIKKEIICIENKIAELNIDYGKAEESINREKQRAEFLRQDLLRQTEYTVGLGEKLWEEYNDAEAEYLKIKKDRSSAKLKENYERTRKANQTLREKSETEMIRAMQAYKSAHDFGAADSLLGYPEFAAEYDKLKNSKLLEYEDKVYRARNAAEEEFREQFLAKLQENIRQARMDFRELNRALSEISFAREQYEFLYEPKSSMKKFYTMIMDDRNIGGGDSIFGTVFMNEHREVIDELFNKLTLNDDDETDKLLEQYTDYRTYMDYDIKIILPDGNYMLYSKVSAEKSGGETQSPFYITVAASFIQMYKSSVGGDPVGLMMMDEAFNNMDDERMGSVLEFMTNPELHLQLIIAAPPGKIQDIGKYTDKVLLAMPEGKYSFIEDFTNETL